MRPSIKIFGAVKKYMSIIAALALILVSSPAEAQRGKRFYVSGGWQVNGTLRNEVAQSFEGHGAYLEQGFYLTPMLAMGGFISFSTNNQYFPSETHSYEDGAALTTDYSRSVYQVPFGSTIRVRFMRNMFQPYVEAKVGGEYSVQGTYISIFASTEDNWGFYVSPEIGLVVYPFYMEDIGFQVAAYYSYSSNRSYRYDMHGINNLGFKLGLAF
jgi:hypothetical protein